MTGGRQLQEPPHPPKRRRSLDCLFEPRSVAVIGATDRPRSVGRTVLANLLGAFKGTVFPVNPKRTTVLDTPAFPNVEAIPEPVDLAVVVTPADTVPDLIDQCGRRGISAAIVISAGFKELGPTGVELERRVLENARRYGMRVLGPNCLGLMNPMIGLNATFAASIARPGKVAFLSQSGALCTSILDWSLDENVGFSAFVSVGSMLDVSWGDLIDYVGRDPHTSSILLYVESVGDARSFLSAARQVALVKPIIVIKAGRTEAASKAAVSHTGSLAGSAMIFDAAMQRVGVLQVDRIADLFSMAEVLGKQPCPKGPRLTIVTNAGGPGVLATDALVEGGGELATLAPATIAALNEFLPPHWSRGNPIDVLGDGDAERFYRATEIAANDPSSDGLLVILAPQDMTDPTATARRLAPLARSFQKPVLASWMGGPMMREAIVLLNQASIPTFDYPDTAARAFNYLQRYSANLRNLYETPSLVSDDIDDAPERKGKAERILAAAREEQRTLLTEVESKELLSVYGIPTVETRRARSVNEALEAATHIGYPVVLKIYSLTVTHKTDVGGVELDLKSPDDVKAAYQRIQSTVTTKLGAQHFQGVSVQPMISREGYELILGGTLDPQFGPVVMFGLGGQLVEVFRDRSFGLPPLNETLANRMMKQTRIYTALQGVRGKAGVDLKAVQKALIEFARMLVERPWIKECDINPLLATPGGVLALDARVVLHDANVDLADLPRPAIRPYPVEHVREVRIDDGTAIRLRPIRLEDEPLMVDFHESLSEDTVHRRYFQLMRLSSRTDHERLIQVCYNDYDREVVLVADYQNPETRRREILGVARLSRAWRGTSAEFSIILRDAWQGRGLGAHLLGLLLEVGRQENVRRFVGQILPGNTGMGRLCDKLGFRMWRDEREGVTRAELDETGSA